MDIKRPEAELHPTLAAVFAYALVWSAGGNVVEDDREAFSDALREIMEGQSINRSSNKFNIPARTLRDEKRCL